MSKILQSNIKNVIIFYMEDLLKEKFTSLGLKEEEVQIYLICLNNRQGLFVSEITKLSKINRSSVNMIIARLIKRGFLTFQVEGQRKLYFAESPEFILRTFERNISDFKE